MRFFLNTNFILKQGSSHKITEFIKENITHAEYPALIYDQILDGQEHFDKALKNLKINFPKINILVNSKQGEPTYRYLNKLANHCRTKDIDCVIAIGGGSTMDLGKGVAFLINNKEDALTYKGFPKNVKDPVPLITCPSLLGSGADISYNAVFIDEDEGRKLGINTTQNFPKLTIIDSELTMGAPESVVISSAMDTLVHCIDSFGSKKHTKMSRIFSIEGFKNTFEVLLNREHMNINFREKLALGSICGITALMNSGDGPTNGFAYYLGVKHNVPHGLAGAIFLKEVVEYNINQGYSEYCMLNKRIDENVNVLLINFEKIYKNLNIPNLLDYNFTKNNLEEFVSGSMQSLSGSFAGNPIDFNEDAVRKVYNNLIMEK